MRVVNDHIRRIIDSLGVTRKEQQNLLEEYVIFLLQRLRSAPNGLIILDSSIDRKYWRVKQEAEQLGYRLFVIRLEVGEAEIKKRIKYREKSRFNYSDYYRELQRWFSDHVHFVEQGKTDFIWDQEKHKDPEGLFKALDELLEK